MSAGTLVGALLQIAVFLAVGWVVGHAWLSRALHLDQEGTWPERFLASYVGAVAFAVALMLVHIVTGGAAFGVAWFVPAVVLVAIGWRLRSTPGPAGVPWARLVPFVALLLVVFAGPAVAGGSSVRTGDPPWHLGWTEQLLAGEPVPTGPAPELGRNAYPWGLHAVMATLVRMVPGSSPLVALEALHVLIALGLPLAAACIARRVRSDAGWAAAAAMALVGGVGWIFAREPVFITSPRNARYGADLVVASPNSVYELLPPALPRELGLVLLGAAAVAVWAAAARVDGRGRTTAGIAIGLVGLVSVPLFVSALIWCLVSAVRAPASRAAWAARVVGVALLVFLVWAGPVASLYLSNGGFVDITPRLGVEWPLPVALASWGILLPLALAGAWWARSRAPMLVACAAATFILLALSIARGVFDWSLAGNATLLHQGRVWPPLHLLGAALAGVALATMGAALTRTKRLVAAGAAALLAVPSPVLASVALEDVIARGAAGFDYGTEEMRSDAFVRQAAAELDASDVVSVDGGADLAFRLFELSGARLANYDDPRLEGNDLRIRYADLAAEWNERIATTGFEPTHIVMRAPDGPLEHALARGHWDGTEWVLIAASREGAP